jgi:hypothetical protein
MENFEEYYKSALELLEAQGHSEVAKLISIPEISEALDTNNNWNGDLDAYSVYVHVSPPIFAKLERERLIQKYEEYLHDALNSACRGESGFFFNSVSIVARSKKTSTDTPIDKTIDASMWKTGYFRMFISHKVENKISASNLKTTMERYGISGFVAHEDIKPSKRWHQEIVNALKTAHSLCAIITPNFIKSSWCDQEVGFALGRGILCIPIKKEADPYGMLGEFQAISSKGKDSNAIAEEIFEILCMKQDPIYLNCLTELFLNAKTLDYAEHWIDLISSIDNLPKDVAVSINNRYKDNPNLFKKKVLQKSNTLFAKFNLAQIYDSGSTNSIDIDELPF